jgi:hypothetical protein
MRRRRGAAGLLVLLAGVLLLGVLGAAPASAELKLPLLPPLPLPSLNPDDALDLTKTVSGVTNLLGDTTEQIVGNTGVRNPGPGPNPDPAPVTKPLSGSSSTSIRRPTSVDSWSLERARRATSGAKSGAPSGGAGAPSGSYTSLVSGGLRAAADRAAALAGPLAAPVALAVFALGLLAFATKGPTRLVKVEEDRQGFRDRRTYRL